MPASDQAQTSAIPIEDVAPVNARRNRPLYQKRKRIYPRIPRGRYRTVKWVAMGVMLAIYYLLPWVRWERSPGAPDQAVLVDIPARKFYFFAIEIWPQEIYYWAGLLILAALGLFLVSSLLGRVWCGYACPQTVWTDLFIHVERWIEGDRNARMRLDKAPWRATKIVRKAAKHLVWIAIGVATGGAWVFYFADAPTLFSELIRFEAPISAYATMAFLTATTYLFAGHAREQICTYVCPYARFQAAMFDENTMMVSYDAARGEPRGKHKAGQSWEGRGDCVDCKLCVAVCPAGIDIRDGQQMECINCALCIDACNSVMPKVGRPRGLIRYDTLRNLESRAAGEAARVRLFRPRTIVYAVLLVGAAVLMMGTLFTRADLDVAVQRDRNPLFVQLSDGSIRNGYTLKVANKSHDARALVLTVSGIAGALIDMPVRDVQAATEVPLVVEPDALGTFRVFVRAPRSALEGSSTDLAFSVSEGNAGAAASYDTVFRGPEP